MFSVIKNIYNKKTEAFILMELFTSAGKLFFFFFPPIERCSMCAPWVTRHTSIRYSSSRHTRVNMGAFCLHRHPVSVNCLCHARMVLSVGGSFAYFARNARCTVTADWLVWYSNTQNDFCPGTAIFSLRTPASSSGRNMNYDEKQLTGGKKLSCSFCLYRFRKYMSYGFRIINFCNPGVLYETIGSIGICHFPLLPCAVFLAYKSLLPLAEWNDLILYNACTFSGAGFIHLIEVLGSFGFFFRTRCICVCGSGASRLFCDAACITGFESLRGAVSILRSL